jgi:hypothetical protein
MLLSLFFFFLSKRILIFYILYLLQLFGTEDPMTFELPVNPELNPNSEKEDDDHISKILQHL